MQPVLFPENIISDVLTIINYMWDDEFDSYQESKNSEEFEPCEYHIFNNMCRVYDWIIKNTSLD